MKYPATCGLSCYYNRIASLLGEFRILQHSKCPHPDRFVTFLTMISRITPIITIIIIIIIKIILIIIIIQLVRDWSSSLPPQSSALSVIIITRHARLVSSSCCVLRRTSLFSGLSASSMSAPFLEPHGPLVSTQRSRASLPQLGKP